MSRRHELMLLVTLAMIPFGITSAVYNASAAEIAAALGLSADDTSWLNIFYILAQLLILPLASWLVYRIGATAVLIGGAMFGLGSTLILGFTSEVVAHFLAWAGLGIAASTMLVAVQVLVLRNLSLKDIALTEGGMMLMTTLLPMGVYPWILAELAEPGLWQLIFAAQTILYIVLLAWLWIRPFHGEDRVIPVKFNLLQAGLMTGAITGTVLVLMRGQFYNWFDSKLLINLALGAGALTLMCMLAISKRWGRGEYIRSDVLMPNKN